jgi:hypothetical protein
MAQDVVSIGQFLGGLWIVIIGLVVLTNVWGVTDLLKDFFGRYNPGTAPLWVWRGLGLFAAVGGVAVVVLSLG